MAANVCFENESCPEFAAIAGYRVHLPNGEIDIVDLVGVQFEVVGVDLS